MCPFNRQWQTVILYSIYWIDILKKRWMKKKKKKKGVVFVSWNQLAIKCPVFVLFKYNHGCLIQMTNFAS